MLRTFETHKIRKTRELSGRLWDFTPAEGEYAGKTQKVMVPSCLETYPGFGNYRGLMKPPLRPRETSVWSSKASAILPGSLSTAERLPATTAPTPPFPYASPAWPPGRIR